MYANNVSFKKIYFIYIKWTDFTDWGIWWYFPPYSSCCPAFFTRFLLPDHAHLGLLVAPCVRKFISFPKSENILWLFLWMRFVTHPSTPTPLLSECLRLVNLAVWWHFIENHFGSLFLFCILLIFVSYKIFVSYWCILKELSSWSYIFLLPSRFFLSFAACFFSLTYWKVCFNVSVWFFFSIHISLLHFFWILCMDFLIFTLSLFLSTLVIIILNLVFGTLSVCLSS